MAALHRAGAVGRGRASAVAHAVADNDADAPRLALVGTHAPGRRHSSALAPRKNLTRHLHATLPAKKFDAKGRSGWLHQPDRRPDTGVTNAASSNPASRI